MALRMGSNLMCVCVCAFPEMLMLCVSGVLSVFHCWLPVVVGMCWLHSSVPLLGVCVCVCLFGFFPGFCVCLACHGRWA